MGDFIYIVNKLKVSLGRPERRMEDNIKKNLTEVRTKQ